MSVSLWRDEGRGAIRCEVDVAIVGGGIAGLAVARQCILRGMTPAVIEARDVASGATGRNAGFAMTGLADHYDVLVERYGRARAREAWAISQQNLRELTEDLIGREGLRCDLVPCGSVVAAWNADEDEHIRHSHALLCADGFDVALLDGVQMAARLGSERFSSGLFVPNDCGVHPTKLVRGMCDRMLAAKGHLLEQHEVRAIEPCPDGRLRVSTSRGDVLAPKAVLATNGYARLLDSYFEPLIRPVRGQVLATMPTAPFLPVLLYTDHGYQYVRQLPDGRVVAGGWRRSFADVEVGFGDETTEDVQSGIELFLSEAWPALAGVSVTHRWSGVMGFSPDGLPLVGLLPHCPAIGFAVGFTGHGLGYALAAARAVVDCITGRADGGFFDAARLWTQGLRERDGAG